MLTTYILHCTPMQKHKNVKQEIWLCQFCVPDCQKKSVYCWITAVNTNSVTWINTVYWLIHVVYLGSFQCVCYWLWALFKNSLCWWYNMALLWILGRDFKMGTLLSEEGKYNESWGAVAFSTLQDDTVDAETLTKGLNKEDNHTQLV